MMLEKYSEFKKLYQMIYKKFEEPEGRTYSRNHFRYRLLGMIDLMAATNAITEEELQEEEREIYELFPTTI